MVTAVQVVAVETHLRVAFSVVVAVVALIVALALMGAVVIAVDHPVVPTIVAAIVGLVPTVAVVGRRVVLLAVVPVVRQVVVQAQAALVAVAATTATTRASAIQRSGVVAPIQDQLVAPVGVTMLMLTLGVVVPVAPHRETCNGGQRRTRQTTLVMAVVAVVGPILPHRRMTHRQAPVLVAARVVAQAVMTALRAVAAVAVAAEV
jgi:hypothetical protein